MTLTEMSEFIKSVYTFALCGPSESKVFWDKNKKPLLQHFYFSLITTNIKMQIVNDIVTSNIATLK